MVAAFTLTLWTRDVILAAEADAAGVDRIGLDLERIGKAERQSGRATWHSPHQLKDLAPLAARIATDKLFVRCNGMHAGTPDEVETLIDSGVGILMLPNFTTEAEVANFVDLVADRARVVPLVERTAAQAIIPILPALGIREIHIGLNDLSIDLGRPNRLEVLASSFMDRLCQTARTAGLRFGVGGLARAGDDSLPVPSDHVIAQHPRLGSTGALLARSFFGNPLLPGDLESEIAALRARLAHWAGQSAEELETARQALLSRVEGAI